MTLLSTACVLEEDPDDGYGGSGTASGASGGGSSGCGSLPEGAYKCSGSRGILVCQDGEWVSEGTCGCSVSVGDPRKPPYAATCKHDGEGSIECSYAFKSCKKCTNGTSCRSL